MAKGKVCELKLSMIQLSFLSDRLVLHEYLRRHSIQMRASQMNAAVAIHSPDPDAKAQSSFSRSK